MSRLIGAVVGTFKVGDGTVVGPPVFQADKPQLLLRGKTINIVTTGDLKQVVVGKARLTLGTPFGSSYQPSVSSIVSPSPDALAGLILTGKTFRTVTPGRQITGKPQLNLLGKTFRVNRDQVMRPGKAQVTLRGGEINKVGKAGLVPTVPVVGLLVPTAVQEYGDLAPTAPEEALLVPTTVEYV